MLYGDPDVDEPDYDEMRAECEDARDGDRADVEAEKPGPDRCDRCARCGVAVAGDQHVEYVEGFPYTADPVGPPHAPVLLADVAAAQSEAQQEYFERARFPRESDPRPGLRRDLAAVIETAFGAVNDIDVAVIALADVVLYDGGDLAHGDYLEVRDELHRVERALRRVERVAQVNVARAAGAL